MNRCERIPAPQLLTASEIGTYGERVAAAFLRRHSYKVLTRNYRTTRGEIDLICRHGDILVFVEVKTRANEDFGRPAESIKSAKEDALRYASQRYLELLGREDVIYRFDAVEVMLQTGKLPVCTLLTDLFA